LLGGVESELRSTTFGVGFCFAAAFLRGLLERAQAPDFLENALRIQLIFEPL